MTSRVALINLLTRQVVHLIHNKVPPAQVEVSHAEVRALHTLIADDALQPLGKLYLDVIVYPCHGRYVRGRGSRGLGCSSGLSGRGLLAADAARAPPRVDTKKRGAASCRLSDG